MYNKIKNMFFVTFLLFFIIFISKYYFSEQNIIFINKSRLSYKILSQKNDIILPILENDTKNIIVYINDIETFKNKKKKRFWERLINNDN